MNCSSYTGARFSIPVRVVNARDRFVRLLIFDQARGFVYDGALIGTNQFDRAG